MAAPLPSLTPEQLAQNESPNVVGASIVLPLLATIAVGLRFLAREIHGMRYQSDDWILIPAVVLCWGLGASTIIAAQNGLGKHTQTIFMQDPNMLFTLAKAYYTTEPLWAAAIPFVKLSLLILYVRIFGRLRYVRITAYSLGAFTVAWAIVVVFVCIFQCTPISAAWTHEGKCIQADLFFQILSTMNTVTDFVLLILPLTAIWTLSLSKSNRFLILGIFLLGSLTCIFSLIRTVWVFTHSNDPDIFSLTYVAIFSIAEPTLGIVAACLVTLRPLFHYSVFDSFMSKFSSTYSKRSNSQGSKTLGNSSDQDTLNLKDHGKVESYGFQTSITGKASRSPSREREDVSHDQRQWAITVKTQWQQSHS